MKKFILILTAIVLFFYAGQVEAATLDKSNLSKGLLGVAETNGKGKLKVRIQNGNEKYDYNLNDKGRMEYFSLQMGNGNYTVTVFQNVSGNKYKTLSKEQVSVNITDKNAVYLNSIQNVAWNTENKAVKHGATLASGQTTAKGKVDKFFDFVVKNIRYDDNKNIGDGGLYVPSIDTTFDTKKGICYDYSALLAAMDRSNGIPTKLVKGYATGVDGYHAWNEILIDGKWIIVDSTTDSVFHHGGKTYVMAKNAADYKKVREY